jgi:hypothetical protein
MAFIQAPSYIPPKLYDPWGGLADIFGDISNMRETKRQRKRQEVTDAQRLASYKSQETGRSLANQLKRAQLNTYQQSVKNVVWDLPQIEALVKQAGETGDYDALAFRLPKGVITNLKNVAEWRNKINLGIHRANTEGDRAKVDALKIKAGEVDAAHKKVVNEIYVNTVKARRRTAESTAKEAEGTEQSNINYARNQAESAKIRAANALRTQQESIQKGQDFSTIAGQNFVPVDRGFGVSDQSQKTIYDKQFLDALNRRSAESPGTYTPERRAELLNNLTVADVAAGKGTWEIMKDRSGLNRSNLTKSLADSMKSYVTGMEGIDADEFSVAEQKMATNNIMRIVEQVHRENPNLNPYDIYMNILSSPHNFLTIEDKPGRDDVVPMTYSNIMKNLNLTGPNAQNQQGNQTNKELTLREHLTNQVRSKFPKATTTQIEATVNARMKQLGG